MKKTAFLFCLSVFLSIAMAFAAFGASRVYDVNCDGSITLLDVLVVLRASITDAYDAEADLNLDGEVTVQDVLMSLQCLLNENETTTKAYTYADIVERMTNVRHLAVGNTGERTVEYSSYDRASKYENGVYSGWDGNGDSNKYIETTADGGFLLAEMEGAGYISRIWSAAPAAGHIKIFIDGAATPAVDIAYKDFFSQAVEPFTYPNLCYADAALGRNCYVPITFAKSCRVVAYEGWGSFYQITCTMLAEGDTVESTTSLEFLKRQSEALQKADDFFGAKLGTHPEGLADAPFETFTVTKDAPAVKTLSGKGAVNGLLVRLYSDAPDTSLEVIRALKDLRIRIWWDGAETPAVEAPLGDFFGSAYGIDKLQTLTLGVRADKTLYNYFYMPYLTGAKIEISSVGASANIGLSVNVSENAVPQADMLYYGTQFNAGVYAEDPNRWPDQRFLKVEGAGRLVGVTQHVAKYLDGISTDQVVGVTWWGEGDEKFFVDGETFPSWFGTGTEDFYGYAWCSPDLFTKAFHAQSYCRGRQNDAGNRVLTRLLVNDSVAFTESFDGYIEKYYLDEYVRYGFTSYFYLARNSTVTDKAYDHEAVLDYYVPDPSAYASGFVEGEELRDLVLHSENGRTAVQNMESYGIKWSGYRQLLVADLQNGDVLEALLPAPADGEYVLLASFTHASSYGILQCLVDGAAVGDPIDLYSATVQVEELTEVGKVQVKGGFASTLALTVVGKNPSSAGYQFGIDFLLLVPADEYTSVGNVDLTPYTKVIRTNAKVTERTSYHFEAEENVAFIKVSGGKRALQLMNGFGDKWCQQKQVTFSGGGVGDTFTFPIAVSTAGTYTLWGGFTTAENYGIVEFYVNGTKIGDAFDGYTAGVKHLLRVLGTAEFKTGENIVTVKITGKNESATAYYFGVDFLALDPAVAIFEGEGMFEGAVASGGNIRTQTINSALVNGGQQMFWTATGADQTLTATVTVDRAGTYRFDGGFCMAKDYGIVDIFVNGTKIGTFDGYAPALRSATAQFGTATLVAGENTVVFKAVGKNDAATKYYVGIDYLLATLVQ